MTYVLDACALLAWLKGEPGADTISALLADAVSGETALYMSALNLLEVCYGFYRELGAARTARIKQKIDQLPITVIDGISNRVFESAMRLKATYRCSLADCIGLATALEHSAHFVTSDHHELEEVEQNEGISFLWLPPKPKR